MNPSTDGKDSDEHTGVAGLNQNAPNNDASSHPNVTPGVHFLGSMFRNKDDSSTANASDGAKQRKNGKSTLSWRTATDQMVVGLKSNALDRSTREKRHRLMVGSNHSRRSVASQRGKGGAPSRKFSVEEKEEEAHAKAMHNPLLLLYLGNLASVKVMVYYMSMFVNVLCRLLLRALWTKVWLSLFQQSR